MDPDEKLKRVSALTIRQIYFYELSKESAADFSYRICREIFTPPAPKPTSYETNDLCRFYGRIAGHFVGERTKGISKDDATSRITTLSINPPQMIQLINEAANIAFAVPQQASQDTVADSSRAICLSAAARR